MGIKETIGHKIREEREKHGFSREQLCGSEEELTVRQLVRIELGQSLPSIVKLEYIADVLETDLSILLAGENIDIPEEYFAMKYQLFKFPSYGDPERLAKKSQMIEDIYDKFFDLLPEEELLTLEITDNALDYLASGKTASAEEIFDDIFRQLLLKKQYTLNDLCLVSYHALHCQDQDYDKEILQTLEDKVLIQNISGDEYYNIEFLGSLTCIGGVYVEHNEYSKLKPLVDRMHEIVAETQQLYAKPGVLIFEAKYYLYGEKNKEKAKECYDAATLLAQHFGDEVFERNLLAERKKDQV